MQPHPLHRRVHGRHLLIGLAAALFAGLAPAQSSYPNRPIKLVVPSSAGAITDATARALGIKLGAELGQSVVVENKPGGGGRIAPPEVARAAPDGYTLLYANNIGQALLPAVAKSVAYDPIKDFTPVAMLYAYTTVLVCHPSVPANSVAELIDYARKNPNKLKMASAGQGSGNHFIGELFNATANVQTLHVPYKGSGPAMLDVIAGVADCTHDGAPKRHLDAGSVKGLAVASLTRDPRYPNLPTLDESGLKGFEMIWWQAIVGPAHMPPEIVEKLRAALQKTVNNPELKAQVYEIGLNANFGGPDQVVKAITADMAKFKQIAAAANITLE